VIKHLINCIHYVNSTSNNLALLCTNRLKHFINTKTPARKQHKKCEIKAAQTFDKNFVIGFLTFIYSRWFSLICIDSSGAGTLAIITLRFPCWLARGHNDSGLL